jgi:hypothetical protein
MVLPTLKPPGHLRNVPLDQDIPESPFFTETEATCWRNIQLLDRFKESEDPNWKITKIIKHKAKRWSRRLPGTYNPHQTVHDKVIQVLAEFYDGTQQWIPALTLKRTNPIPLIQYVQANKYEDRPYFQWLHLVKPDRLETLTKAFNAKLNALPRYKFGIQLPTNAKHALLLDRLNGNNLWAEAIAAEMKQLKQYSTFRRARPSESLHEYQRIPYHLVFDVKFDGRRKARLVANGNHTIVPAEDVYSGVVGIQTIRLILALAAQRDLLVMAADIGNAFLYADNKEKTRIRAGPEFGEDHGHDLIVQGFLPIQNGP